MLDATEACGARPIRERIAKFVIDARGAESQPDLVSRLIKTWGEDVLGSWHSLQKTIDRLEKGADDLPSHGKKFWWILDLLSHEKALGLSFSHFFNELPPRPPDFIKIPSPVSNEYHDGHNETGVNERSCCLNCMFSAPHDDAFRSCKRYPPQLLSVEESEKGRWPLVHIKDWCGEHARNELDMQYNQAIGRRCTP